MTGLETNIFKILNLEDVSTTYRLYRIRGLASDSEEYFRNREIIARSISRRMRTPAVVLDLDGLPHLALREGAAEPSSPFPVIRTAVRFDKLDEVRQLDYTRRESAVDPLCLRYLQFCVQEFLLSNYNLWQPGSGHPFFNKQPKFVREGVAIFEGYSVRVVPIPDGGFGVCVDLAHKLLSASPLSHKLSRDEFRAKLRGKHAIYHYGQKWYEVQLEAYSDLSVSEYSFRINGRFISLLDFISMEVAKPLPKEIAELPFDGTVLLYRTSTGEERAVPSGLCFIVADTSNASIKRLHKATIVDAPERRSRIHEFVREFLSKVRFGGRELQVSLAPVTVPHQMFLVPDLKFGNGKTLSLRGSKGAQQVTLDQLGRVRRALLRDPNVGFFSKDPLQRQYLFLPQTVIDSYGDTFVRHLKKATNELFPNDGGYEPVVIAYNDRVARNFVEQGRAFIDSLNKTHLPGYAVVMIHDVDRRVGQEDQLGALVIRKCREKGIVAAVIHSATSREAYELLTRAARAEYVVKQDQRGRFSGYLSNVALSKILLTNERWPFVLASPLHSDVTIGIDVKNHSAAFTLLNSDSSIIRTRIITSKQKEELLSDQVCVVLSELIKSEFGRGLFATNSLVVHRDGRLWETELLGIRSAIKKLQADGFLSTALEFALLEIPKSSPVSLRLIDVTSSGTRQIIENPQVGTYLISERDAYICATGRAFPRRGTVHPLHVRYADGTLPFLKCVEDVYSLSALAWTRPEDCSRFPITMRLNDRRLTEEATEFDEDAVEYTGKAEAQSA